MTLLALDSRVTTGFVVAGGLLLFGILLIATAAGELAGRRKAKVPPAMRAAASDEELERRVIERYLLWGALATVFMALWLPAYWIREPTRMNDMRVRFTRQALERGHEDFLNLCASCHGDEAEGGSNPFVLDGVSHTYPEPPLRYVYSRYQLAGRKDDEITQILYDAINRGRPNTPMPTWGLAFGGPLNPQQVDDIVGWLQSIQEPFPTGKGTGSDLFAANCAQCHGKAGEGGIGPNLTVAFGRLTSEQVEATIKNGRLNINRPSMPAWAGLGDDAVDALVRFLQSIQRG